MSWSKFKYDLSKKQKGNKKNKSEVKEMQFKPFIGEGDIEHKVRQIKKFIDDNNKVKIKVRYKRPATPEKIDETMSKIELLVTEFADIDIPRKKEGRDLAIYIKSK